MMWIIFGLFCFICGIVVACIYKDKVVANIKEIV